MEIKMYEYKVFKFGFKPQEFDVEWDESKELMKVLDRCGAKGLKMVGFDRERRNDESIWYVCIFIEEI